MIRSIRHAVLAAAFAGLGVQPVAGAPPVSASPAHPASASAGPAPAPALHATAHQADAYTAVDACVRQEMAAKGIRGASLAIAMDGKLVHTAAFGVKDAATGEAVDTATMFRINSTTKMMTAAAVMQQVEAGNLDLDAPITAVVPGFRVRPPWSADDITLHTLLSNTAALPDPYLDYPRFPVVYDMPPFDLGLGAWASRLATMHLYARPGSFWNYSSPNFSLAALAVEKVTGTPYSDYVTTRLWRPAGMTVTTFESSDFFPAGNYATGYYRATRYDPGDYDRLYARPAGGAYSTPTELITWALTLMDGGSILSAESIAAMTTPHVSFQAVPWSPTSSYGYGIFADPYRRLADPSGATVRVLRHPGNGRGYSTELAWVPELGFAVATLINNVTSLGDTVDCALREVAGLAPAPAGNLKTPAATWGKYAGTYNMTDVYGDRWTARVDHDGRGLTISYPDWTLAPTIAAAVPAAPMTQLFLGTFRYGGYGDNTVSFVADRAGGDRARWMRSRYQVGQRVGDLPAAIELAGAACAPVTFTPGLDAPRLQVTGHGLSRVLRLRDEAIAQDDPDDPTSATIRLDVDTTGPLAFLTAWLFEEEDDNVEMYLLQDIDGDGAYTWPEELVDRLTQPRSQGVFVPARAAGGPYQLWIQGQAVRGQSSDFDLDVVAISGTDLRVAGAPAAAEAGQTVTFDVCATPPQGASASPAPPGADAEPWVGIVEIDLGAPATTVRLPIHWRPAASAPPAVYLPALGSSQP